jgi:hypothetical protein
MVGVRPLPPRDRSRFTPTHAAEDVGDLRCSARPMTARSSCGPSKRFGEPHAVDDVTAKRNRRVTALGPNGFAGTPGGPAEPARELRRAVHLAVGTPGEYQRVFHQHELGGPSLFRPPLRGRVPLLVATLEAGGETGGRAVRADEVLRRRAGGRRCHRGGRGRSDGVPRPNGAGKTTTLRCCSASSCRRGHRQLRRPLRRAC